MSRRTTIMILRPGRDALSLDLSSLLALRASLLLFLLPLGLGIGGQRCWEMTRTTLPPLAMGSLSRIAGGQIRVHAHLPDSEPRVQPSAAASLLTAMRPIEGPVRAMPAEATSTSISAIRTAGVSPLEGPAVLSVKAIIQALSVSRRRTSKGVDPATVPINGVLRLQALHLGETLSARCFDDLLRPDPRAFEDVKHLMRCRVTGQEIEMDPQLIGILSQLSTLYGRTLQLVSGHRAPGARGTSESSQHTLGRAADIRIPGVRIDDLKQAAIKLGARGVGIYPEKGFVHIDVRQKQRYYWSWTARAGEQADWATRRPSAHQHGDQASEAEDSEPLQPGEAEANAASESSEAPADRDTGEHGSGEREPTAAEPALIQDPTP